MFEGFLSFEQAFLKGLPHNPAGADKSEGRGVGVDSGGAGQRTGKMKIDEEEEMEGRSQHSEEIAVADWSVLCLAYQPVVCCRTAPTSLNALCFWPALPFLSKSFLNMILFGSPSLFVEILFEWFALFTRFFHCCVACAHHERNAVQQRLNARSCLHC